MKYFYKRSVLYSIIQFVSLFLGLAIFHFAAIFMDGASYEPITFIGLEIIIAVISLIYLGIECTATIEIDDDNLIERKFRKCRKTELENIVGIRYYKSTLKIFAFVMIDLSNGSSLRLENWFENHTNMVKVICKNTLLKNSNVLLSDNIKGSQEL